MIMMSCLIKDPPLQLLQLSLGVQGSKWHQLRTWPRADLSTDSEVDASWLFLSSFQGKEGLFIYLCMYIVRAAALVPPAGFHWHPGAHSSQVSFMVSKPSNIAKS